MIVQSMQITIVQGSILEEEAIVKAAQSDQVC